MARLTHAFFDHDTLTVAQGPAGKIPGAEPKRHPAGGRITETEAYIGRCDKACHAYNYRRTPRTETLFPGPRPCLYLFHLRHVPLPELRHGTGRRALPPYCCGR